MGYSISEGIEDAKRRLEAEVAIAERFPDAYLSDLPDGSQVWTSERVEPDEFRIVVGKDRAYFCPYTMVKTLAVFTTHWKFVDAAVFAMDLKKKQPDLHKDILTVLGQK